MRKDFPLLVKELRLALSPEFKTILAMNNGKEFDEALNQFESKRNKMIEENGYSVEEFDSLSREYSTDFSAENPDEWKIEKIEAVEEAK